MYTECLKGTVFYNVNLVKLFKTIATNNGPTTHLCKKLKAYCLLKA